MACVPIHDLVPLNGEQSSSSKPGTAGHAEVPPSPDETFAKANQSDYSSPGQHPAQDKKNLEPDMDNASQAAKQQARLWRLHLPGE